MPNDSKPDQPQVWEGALKNFTLLALPWLTYQRQILDIAKKSITDTTGIRPTENLMATQLHALMMIFDRSRTWRNLVDNDFEKRVENAYKELFPKVASASVQFIDAQEKILASIFDALVALKNDDEAKKRQKSRQ
jgi:hypothetical protein